MELPTRALSVRQPWAWAIIHAGKDIENRSWQAVNYGLNVRGRIAIHAAKGMTREEYEDGRSCINEILRMAPASNFECPAAIDLKRGGVIGSVNVVDVVTESDSDWFMGPRALVLRDPEACEFVPCIGALGYFTWKGADPSVVPPPAKWMLPPKPATDPDAPPAIRKTLQGTLL
jgi:hypothetical protein